VNEIDYLVISSSIDFSTDLVCYQLSQNNKRYYRLNRDEFLKHKISIDVAKKTMTILIDGIQYTVYFDKLKGIYYRSPTFLRTQPKSCLTVNEQLMRNQWSAFLRNLIVFNKCKWINNPVDTYRAENKIFQLQVAEESGIKIPMTFVTNYVDFDINRDKKYVIKSIDTALFYDFENNKEMFTYSNVVSGYELLESNLTSAPVIVQEFLDPKIDCRVTFIDGKLFPIQITKNQQGIVGDWRLKKEELEYIPFILPKKIEESLIRIMNKLHLLFGGIDLAIVNDKYYFIEVNPTGEWGWLEDKNEMKISKAIMDALCK